LVVGAHLSVINMIAYIVSYSLIVIWVLIPFRQKNTTYFYYFLVYALSSLLLLAINLLIQFKIYPVHPAYIYLGQGFFLIVSLYRFQKIPHYVTYLSFLLIFSIAMLFFLSIDTIVIILIVTHIVIFLLILKNTILYIQQTEKLNLFHFLILLFEISAIARFIVIIANLKTGYLYFVLTAALGILIGIFFLFYNEKNSPKLNLSKEKT
jgi:hypothetical protein